MESRQSTRREAIQTGLEMDGENQSNHSLTQMNVHILHSELIIYGRCPSLYLPVLHNIVDIRATPVRFLARGIVSTMENIFITLLGVDIHKYRVPIIFPHVLRHEARRITTDTPVL